jgi:hypothetical protein
MAENKYVDMTLERALQMTFDDPEAHALLTQLGHRIQGARQEMDFFRAWCDRADALYFADTFTTGGADLWPADKTAQTPGRSHVSINTPAVYVDVPAALQAVAPIENMLATDTTPEARSAASALERVYTAWKAEEDFDLKFHIATTVKALYGRTAGRIVWDDEDDEPGGRGHPEVQVIEQPRHLWMGWRTDSYDELEWVAYVIRYEPNALRDAFGVVVTPVKMADGTVPAVSLGELPQQMQWVTSTDENPREWLSFGGASVEVWDYWYRKPKVTGKGKNRKVKMETYNCVFAGNALIQGPTKYEEYDGDLPYVPLFNTLIPGVPTGRSELHDIEHLIREKYEKVTAGSQMIANAVAGDYWQLVGPDAPTRVPAGLKPQRNKMVGPGPGNRIEVITPFVAQFQLEQYLGRLDREAAAISGLNDLLLGLAPAQVLSSSKAINALIANYESRLSMRRKLLYKWRRDLWSLALKVWRKKDDAVAEILDAGAGRLEIIDPSLSPRDDMETAQRAGNLVIGKLWSQRRGMDAVGVDDPETEQDLIREESTDATLWPDRVQVMAQLLGALQSLGLQAPPGAQAQAQGQLASGQQDLRRALGEQTPDNTTSSQLPGDQGQNPGVEGLDAQGVPLVQPPEPAVLQGMVQNGQAKGRIMTNQKLGRR